jgi:hypothetical protein
LSNSDESGSEVRKPDNCAIIAASIIGAIAAIVAALITYKGQIDQVLLPIVATRTAEAEAYIPTPIPIFVTQVSPSFTVVNSLVLPIEISVDGVNEGIVEKYSSKTFVIDTYPVRVDWKVIKQMTASVGISIGHDMWGNWDAVSNQEVVTVDYHVGERFYFYPIISNLTGQTCNVIINQGLLSEFDTHATLLANSSDVGFGYYELYTNSNVTVQCGENTYWWGRKGEDQTSTRIQDLAQLTSGVVQLVLNPH